MDFSLLSDMTTDKQQAMQTYVKSQLMQRLAAAQRNKDADTIKAQPGEGRRRTQPEEKDSRGSDEPPTDRLMEGLTRAFDDKQAERAEKQQQSTEATIKPGNVVVDQTGTRIPAVEAYSRRC